MIPIQKAKSIIQKHIPLLEVETVSLNNTGNRVLAQDIVATFPMPMFDNSAMDGFLPPMDGFPRPRLSHGRIS